MKLFSLLITALSPSIALAQGVTPADSCGFFKQAQCALYLTTILSDVTSIVSPSYDEVKAIIVNVHSFLQECGSCMYESQLSILCETVDNVVDQAGELFGIDIDFDVKKCKEGEVIDAIGNPFPTGGGPISSLGVVTDNFEKSVKDAKVKSDRVYSSTGTLKESVSDLDDSLAIPKETHNLADEVDDLCATISALLTVVGFIPPIAPAVRTLNTAIGKVRRPGLKTVIDVTKRMKTKAESVRKKVQNFENKLATFRSQVNTARNIEASILARVNGLNKVVAENPGAISDEVDRKMDALTVSMKLPVDKFNLLQDSTQGVVTSTLKETQTARGYLSDLSEIKSVIKDIDDLLKPLKSPLNSLKSALDQNICPLYWGPCFTVGDVLQQIDNLMGIVVDAAMAVIQPILDQLGLDIKLPSIPGLDAIEDIENAIKDIEGVFDNALIEFTSALQRVTDYTDDFTEFERQLGDLESNYCYDTSNSCDRRYCSSFPYLYFMRTQCKKTCGLC